MNVSVKKFKNREIRSGPYLLRSSLDSPLSEESDSRALNVEGYRGNGFLQNKYQDSLPHLDQRSQEVRLTEGVLLSRYPPIRDQEFGFKGSRRSKPDVPMEKKYNYIKRQ